MNKIYQFKEIDLEDKSYDVRVQLIVTRYAEGRQVTGLLSFLMLTMVSQRLRDREL